jgi:pimeloyl-ACP methyl ester carboxylesterase
VAGESGHWVQLDAPEFVVRAVLEVAAQASKLD